MACALRSGGSKIVSSDQPLDLRQANVTSKERATTSPDTKIPTDLLPEKARSSRRCGGKRDVSTGSAAPFVVGFDATFPSNAADEPHTFWDTTQPQPFRHTKIAPVFEQAADDVLHLPSSPTYRP